MSLLTVRALQVADPHRKYSDDGKPFETVFLWYLSQDSSGDSLEHQLTIGYPQKINRNRSSMLALNVLPSTSTLPNVLTWFVIGLQKLFVESTVENLSPSLAVYIKYYHTRPTANFALLYGSCIKSIKSNLLDEFPLHIFNMNFNTRVLGIHFHYIYY
jgi:hypothetical protein